MRDRVASSLPTLSGRGCRAQAVHRPGNEWCCSSAFPKMRGLRIFNLRRVLRGPSLTGLFSDSAAGNPDTPHDGHRPAVPGQWRYGWVRMVQRAAPNTWSRRRTRQSLTLLKSLKRSQIHQPEKRYTTGTVKVYKKAVTWCLEMGQVQTPWSFLLLQTGQEKDFFLCHVLHRRKNF